jgi:hypothetical protein
VGLAVDGRLLIGSKTVQPALLNVLPIDCIEAAHPPRLLAYITTSRHHDTVEPKGFAEKPPPPANWGSWSQPRPVSEMLVCIASEGSSAMPGFFQQTPKGLLNSACGLGTSDNGMPQQNPCKGRANQAG